MEPLIIVSADGHTGPPPETFRPYLERRYHAALDELLVENTEFVGMGAAFTHRPPELLELIDSEHAISSGGEDGLFDPARRCRELDREGVAAEVLHPEDPHASPPFFGLSNKEQPAELRLVGRRAYHRWLADFMQETGGRHVGVAEPGPCLDMQEMVDELRFVAEHGFVSVYVPGRVADDALPPLHDPHFEPFWATCNELGLSLNVHAGFGRPQGEMYKLWPVLIKAMKGGDLDIGLSQELAQSEEIFEISEADSKLLAQVGEMMNSSEDSPLRLDLTPRRLVWQFILSGVFDRYPDLKVVFTEIRADWVPATLAFLDERLGTSEYSLSMKPSEYWERHCRVVPSSTHRAEVEMRHELGLEHMMFGVDYPHPEGTWPNTHDWIRAAFAGVPEDEARRILGGNAIECFGLDQAALAAVAARIGPAPADVLGDSHEVDPARIEQFHKRGGFAKPAETVNTAILDGAIAEDEHLIGVAGR